MKLKYLLLLSLWLLALGTARAQAPTVRINVLLVPPYSTHLADYVDQPNRLLVSVTNLSRNPVELQLAGNLSSDGGIKVFTKTGYRSPRPFTLDGMQTRSLDQDELRDLFDAGSLVYQGIKAEEIVRGNGLPEGAYTICVRALDYKTQQPLSADAPGGCSRPAMLRALEAPYIIKPAPDEVIKLLTPQNILFTWTRPAGAPPTTEYEFRLVEMSHNSRNINDAFLSGTTPPLYERTVRGAPALLYGPAEPALFPGRRYAFAVRAIDPDGRSVFRNNGRSEVQSFVYGSAAVQYSNNSSGNTFTPPPKAPPLPVPPKSTLNNPLAINTNIPLTIIRGNVKWGWRASEETGISSGTAHPGDRVGSVAQLGSLAALGALADPSAGAAGTAALLAALQTTTGGAPHGAANAHATNGNGFGGGPLTAVATGTIAGPTATLLATSTLVGGGGQATGTTVDYRLQKAPLATAGIGLADLETDVQAAELPAVLGKKRYPLSNQKIELIFDYTPLKKVPGKPVSANAALYAQHEAVLAVGYTDAKGDFALSILAGLGADGRPVYVENGRSHPIKRLRVKVKGMHFFSEPAPYELQVSPGNLSLGQTLCLANSYRLQVNVVDNFGKPATGVNVRLYRNPVWYGNHAFARPEGMRPEDKRAPEITPPGGVRITEATDLSQPLLRLFTNYSFDFTDFYTVHITGDGYAPYTTTLAGWPAGSSYEDGVVTIAMTYTVVQSPPVVRGIVIRKHDSSPVAGASVRLYRGPKDNPAWKFDTQTDAKGRFNIETKGPNPNSWTLLVTGAGIEGEWEEAGIKINNWGPAGIVEKKVVIDAALHPVVGRVANEDGSSLAANLRWKSGGAIFQSDAQGRFLDIHQAGPDTLIISKVGYKELRVGVWVDGDGLTNPATGQKGSAVVYLLTGVGASSQTLNMAGGSLAKMLDKAGSLKALAGEPPFQLPGTAQGQHSRQQYDGGSPHDKNAMLKYLHGLLTVADAPLGEGQDLGKFTLIKLVGRLRVTVLAAETGKPVPGAIVALPNAVPALGQTTGNDGKVYFAKAPGGPGVQVRVSSPTSGAVAYVPALQDVTIATNGTVTELVVKLVPGTRLNGTVTASGQPVAGAKINLLGRPDMEVKTLANGQYEIVGVPKGSQTLVATRQGLVGQSQTQTFVPGQNVTLNFTLTNAGFAIDKLLGFPIEVTSVSKGSDTTLVGSFVNLPGNAVFAVKADVRLAFTAKVRVAKNGLLRAKGQNFIQTDAPELALTAFNFLPVKIAASAGLKVQALPGQPDKGQLAGAVEANYGSLGNNLGWAWGNGVKTYLSDAAGTGAVPALPVLVAAGASAPAAPSLRLRAPAATVSLTLYSFGATVDLAQSSVAADGLHLAGSVKLEGMAGAAKATVQVPTLWIGPAGNIKTAALSFSPSVSASISGFGFTLEGGSLSETGFKLNGSMSVQPLGSEATTVSFSDLTIGKTGVSGGSFVLPEGGLDVFGLARFKPVAGVPLAFGSDDGGKTSFLSGGASTTLPLLDQTLTVSSFTVRSDGKFAAVVPADFHPTFAGMATLDITSVGFKTIDGFGIDVAGDVRLELPGVKAEAGTLRYRTGQKYPTLEKVGLHVDIGVGQLGGTVSFLDNGFAGTLNLNVVSVVSVDAGFKYQKLPDGVAFDADIVVGLQPIPIGPGLFLNSIGGGVSYGGGSLKSVTLRGSVTIAGIEAGLALKPIEVTVLAGPVIKGTANLTVFNMAVANAALTLDWPNSLASVEVQVDVTPLPDLANASAAGIVVISGKQNDTYWAMGLTAQVKLLGLLDVNANILMGQGLNVANHKPDLGAYTSFINPNYLSDGTTVYGAHLQGMSKFGRHKEDAYSKCFWKACGKIWYYNESLATLNANFKDNAYGVGFASGWGGGAELKVMGFNVGGIGVSASGGLDGSYSSNKGWNIHGQVGGTVTGYVGDCSDECENKICWYYVVPDGVKLCAGAKLNVDYSSKSGMGIGLDI